MSPVTGQAQDSSFDVKPVLHRDLVITSFSIHYTKLYDKEDLRLEICNACHPFFTGKQKLIDKAGRVDRFRKRYAKVAPADSYNFV